ncbi:hypothetical protein Hypma_005245 [Hypsizygus marmoreus]|uniref:Uncharacterized protein n=1 Tax=Hypsizygus marmoreus TaxID=39966 RepID=A0A369IZA6_HYPMA|nr:hypothetical protein Hypma_005245 [Hypsizygus marmoreus]
MREHIPRTRDVHESYGHATDRQNRSRVYETLKLVLQHLEISGPSERLPAHLHPPAPSQNRNHANLVNLLSFLRPHPGRRQEFATSYLNDRSGRIRKPLTSVIIAGLTCFFDYLTVIQTLSSGLLNVTKRTVHQDVLLSHDKASHTQPILHTHNGSTSGRKKPFLEQIYIANPLTTSLINNITHMLIPGHVSLATIYTRKGKCTATTLPFPISQIFAINTADISCATPDYALDLFSQFETHNEILFSNYDPPQYYLLLGQTLHVPPKKPPPPERKRTIQNQTRGLPIRAFQVPPSRMKIR